MRVDTQLISSILLGSLSLIPNNALRYVTLASTVAFALLYRIQLRPAAFLLQLTEGIKQTEEVFEEAKLTCVPRDRFSLAVQWVRLLEVKQSMSEMQCRLWALRNTSWKQHWHFNQRVVECVNKVDDIRTAVQLILEAEVQRRIAQDITETHTTLANAQSACAGEHRDNMSRTLLRSIRQFSVPRCTRQSNQPLQRIRLWVQCRMPGLKVISFVLQETPIDGT
ncbi:hypothetical protein C8R47DRAFT_1103399 [Mycena vitilis]|nr:hypothetical protein C8R47DRAFT_1103399 [Mycena vitilis]